MLGYAEIQQYDEAREKAEELKPCPFCGSEDIYVSRSGLDDDASTICCKSCGAKSGLCDDEATAINTWNTRFDKPPLLPCPFCGSADVSVLDAGRRNPSYYVGCESCGAVSCSYKDEPDAVKEWNRRVER